MQPRSVRLHLGPLSLAPVAVAGETLLPACTASGGLEGERTARSMSQGGLGGMDGLGGVFHSCALEPTPRLSLCPDPPHPGPCPELSAPYGRIPPPISALIAYPVSSSVFSADPPIYSAQDPVSCFHPCSFSFRSHSFFPFHVMPLIAPRPAPNLPSLLFLLLSFPTSLPHSPVFPQLLS